MIWFDKEKIMRVTNERLGKKNEMWYSRTGPTKIMKIKRGTNVRVSKSKSHARWTKKMMTGFPEKGENQGTHVRVWGKKGCCFHRKSCAGQIFFQEEWLSMEWRCRGMNTSILHQKFPIPARLVSGKIAVSAENMESSGNRGTGLPRRLQCRSDNGSTTPTHWPLLARLSHDDWLLKKEKFTRDDDWFGSKQIMWLMKRSWFENKGWRKLGAEGK